MRYVLPTNMRHWVWKNYETGIGIIFRIAVPRIISGYDATGPLP